MKHTLTIRRLLPALQMAQAPNWWMVGIISPGGCMHWLCLPRRGGAATSPREGPHFLRGSDDEPFRRKSSTVTFQCPAQCHLYQSWKKVRQNGHCEYLLMHSVVKLNRCLIILSVIHPWGNKWHSRGTPPMFKHVQTKSGWLHQVTVAPKVPRRPRTRKRFLRMRKRVDWILIETYKIV